MEQAGLPRITYGIHAVEALLTTHLETIDHVYIDNSKRSQPLFNIMKICRRERLAYNLVPPQKLDQMAGTSKHQGAVALCSVKPYTTPDELQAKLAGKKSPLFIVAASVEDPQNLGALMRSCVAFGADALFLERKNTAPLSGATAKASAGMIEHCTVLKPKNLEGILRGCREAGFLIAGTHAQKGVPPAQIDLIGPTVIILGGEHRGMPPYLGKLCTVFISIPMAQHVQSLNVSSAGAVLLYECARQRNKKIAD